VFQTYARAKLAKRYLALIDAHEFELDSLQISAAADLEAIGLPPAATTAIVTHFKPAPAPEADEPEPELSASAQQLAALTAVPMAEWSEEQVLAWAELVELEPETKAALRTAFEEDDTDGNDLAMLPTKRLQKMLKKADLDGDLPAAAAVVLALRDALLTPAAAAAPLLPPHLSTGQNEQRHAVSAMSAVETGLAAAATATAAATVADATRTLVVAVADAAGKAEEAAAKAEEAAAKAAPSCQICFEPYGGAVVPRILVACGHTFCESCLSTMLRCAAAHTHARTIARRSARVTPRPGSRAGCCRPRAGASGWSARAAASRAR
jgi:hypothetical protein